MTSAMSFLDVLLCFFGVKMPKTSTNGSTALPNNFECLHTVQFSKSFLGKNMAIFPIYHNEKIQ